MKVLGHSLVSLLFHSYCSLICLLCTGCIARTLRCAHSFARSLARPFTCSRAHGKEVFVYELNASISCSFNPLWAACLCVSVSVRVCMHVSPLHFVSIVQVGNKRFREFEIKRFTDGRMYGQMDGQTDGPTDGWMD